MLAKYACDACRARKVRCTRETPQCVQCLPDSRDCTYSRQGVIRRNRKGKRSTPLHSSAQHEISDHNQADTTNASVEFESQLEADIHAAQEDLNAVHLRWRRYSRNLASLSAEYTSFWQDPSFIEMAERLQAEGSRQFFTFEDQAESWNQIFTNILKKGSPWFRPVPPEILPDLAAHPERVRQKAYLVIFYGIMLTIAAADRSAYGEDTISKMQWNLWLALNDARLLLEPSDLNIEALFLLGMHVQDFHTPSLCWMLLTTACRMLQALGITSRTFDSKTRERRLWLFWTLSSLDISLALIFGRPPTFHRAMREKMPMFEPRQLLGYQPHIDSSENGRTSYFGVNFFQEIYKLSNIMAEIWSCLYDAPNTHRSIEAVKEALDSWYKGASKLLEATYLAERPLMSTAEERSVQLGIKFEAFQYHYHCCVLLRSQRKWRLECLKSSREALSLLDGLVSDSNEVYNGVVWSLLYAKSAGRKVARFTYCPFTPFFVLFGDVLSKGDADSRKHSLSAMERFPEFLRNMAPRHPQAARLHKISASLLDTARMAFAYGLEDTQIPIGERADVEATPLEPQGSRPAAGDQIPEPLLSEAFDSSSFLNFFNEPPMDVDTGSSNFWTPNSMPVGNTSGDATRPNNEELPQEFQLSDMFMQSDFDWFAWDSSVFGFGDNQQGYNPF